MRIISAILVFFLSIGLAISPEPVINSIKEDTYPTEYREYVSLYANKYGIPEYIIFAVIKVESDFDPNAVSGAGAMGLMQMMPKTFNWLTGDEHLGEYLPVDALYDPEVSIRYGTYYLLYLLRKFDYNRDAAIAAYNGGEGNVASWLRDARYADGKGVLKYIPIKETRVYLIKVNLASCAYENLYY